MLQFLRGDFDVLVSTTIIESGLDIPQANTLVVERADLLGLSQLYQIRGRVGRSDVTAHSYLFYPDRRELSEEARHRLSTLADYTELGSGYRIAMRDLELRGAGSLLGDEQSGHVAAVGFELYCELLAAELGAEVVALRGAKATVSPLRLDSDEVRGLKQRLPRAIYSVAGREVSCRMEPQPGSDRVSMRQGLELLAAILDQRRARAA